MDGLPLMYRLSLALFMLGATLMLYSCTRDVTPSSADHSIYLPYAGTTWMAQQIRATQEQVWCVDSRAANYPNFVSQLRDVNDEYTERAGIHHRQVDFFDPACQVRHRMADSFPCGSGAAACIYYASKPVDVFYQWGLGYSDWRSAHGHELGHGLLGLHEQYQDFGSIQCDAGYNAMVNRLGFETVMSCGTGVRYPTSLDIQRGCAVILTSWCGQQPAPPSCDGPQDPSWGGQWDNCLQLWVHPDGRSYDPATGFWRFNGVITFDYCDTRWGGRHAAIGAWVHVGTRLFFDQHLTWLEAPPC